MASLVFSASVCECVGWLVSVYAALQLCLCYACFMFWTDRGCVVFVMFPFFWACVNDDERLVEVCRCTVLVESQ